MKEQGEKVIKRDNAEELPEYEPPRIEVYDEEELLKNVAVLGCTPFPP